MTDIIDQNILFYVLLVLVEPQCTLINQVIFLIKKNLQT